MKKKFSDVYNKIRFAKMDPKHEKAGKTSTDDEEHYAVDSQEFAQQLAHVKKRAMQEEYVEESNGKKLVKGGSGTENDPHTAHTWVDIHDFGQHMHGLSKKSGKPVHYTFNSQHYKATPESKGFSIKSGTGQIVKEEQGVAEALKGDMHPEADKVLKHIDPKFHEVYKPYLKAGVYKGDYQDRADVLSAAERAGHINKQQGVAEDSFDDASPMTKDTVKADRIRSLKNLIAVAKEQGRQLRVQELELELKKLQGVAEEVEQLDEKNKPTNPELWSRAISMAKSKFDVYPSAYANGWASKWYKSKGGDWKSVKEAKEEQEYDYEGDMAMSDLRSILHNAKQIHDMLKPDTNIPEWCQSKITLAEDYISTVSNYMRGEMNEEVEQIDEISQETKSSYVDKAKKQVDELKPHTKGEYGDIAKRMIARRKKGISMAKVREQIDHNVETIESVNESKKTDIIRKAYKNGKTKKDKFQAEPVISSTVVKADTSATGQ